MSIVLAFAACSLRHALHDMVARCSPGAAGIEHTMHGQPMGSPASSVMVWLLHANLASMKAMSLASGSASSGVLACM